MLGAQSVAKAFPEYPTTIVKVYPPALHLKDYISMAGPEIMTVGKSEGAQKTFLVTNCLSLSTVNPNHEDAYLQFVLKVMLCQPVSFICT